MAIKNTYLLDLLERTKKRNPNEPEFIQAVTEVFTSLEPVIEKRQDLVNSENRGLLSGHYYIMRVCSCKVRLLTRSLISQMWSESSVDTTMQSCSFQ